MNTQLSTALPAAELYVRFAELRQTKRLRHRDAAHELGVPEGAAIAAAVGGRGALRAVRLAGPWPQLFEEMPRLGTVMALTRNETTVHEKIGRFEDMSHEGAMGLALGHAIDLRIFYHRWAHAFAVTEDTAKGEQRSLQIYDVFGEAMHKVFVRAETDLIAWFGFVERHTGEAQHAGEQFNQPQPAPALLPDAEVNAEEFRQAWAAMRDTHEFFPLLRRFKVARTQALRLAPADFAYRVENTAARLLLESAAQDGTSIMCFVGNPGMIQIHSGPVVRVAVMNEWLNVLDPTFNLHLREDRIAASWVVKKPTVDGLVTSVELFDATGETMAMFFGERKPGKPELPGWRALVERLPQLQP